MNSNPKICKNCIYYNINELKEHLCHRNAEYTLNLVTGETVALNVLLCVDERVSVIDGILSFPASNWHSKKCGEQGIFYKEYSDKFE